MRRVRALLEESGSVRAYGLTNDAQEFSINPS